MSRVVVLGTGLVGSYIVNKLVEEGLEVAACDISEENLKKCNTIHKYKLDLSNSQVVSTFLSGETLAVNALPGFLGYQTLKICIEKKVNVVDISFMPEDFLKLDSLAKKKKVTAICDFGFAPGISHMFVQKLQNKGLKDCQIWVGGLPKSEEEDYKAVFSPKDVIEEYTRTARYLENYKVCEEEPFEKAYYYEDLEGFISDGLRSLLKTSKMRCLVEYTLRYHNHFEAMAYMKKAGFFNKENIDLTSNILVKAWKMTPDYIDKSILEVVASDDKYNFTRYIMKDAHDGTSHSMARCTGLPAVAMILLLSKKKYKKQGIIPPEEVAKHSQAYNFIIKYLKSNGIYIKT